ncbi:MAG: tRNA 2-thiouridine(34) synthase MnmA [Alphaproteobacteria bacterium]|nr:tRNA 2-thiouridine(34) synthase MnmA [Alphaproteobacteria bacterium]
MSDGLPEQNSAPPRRVAVALSGGVDSAVVAVMLLKQGFDVFALTLHLCDGDDLESAARVAQFLKIDHRIIDARQPFRTLVMEPFAQSYRRGETPVPCALCNRFIKFGLLMEQAQELGAHALATGHYARSLEGVYGVELHKGIDPRKDQSYFLFGLSRDQLSFARFPLGSKTKEETRALAARYALPVAERAESQDICFVKEQDYVQVVRSLDPLQVEQSGEIVDLAGKVLGQHQGISHFTIGQRRGLNLGQRDGDRNEPLFVVALDPAAARVIVGPHQALAQKEVFLRDVNWLGDSLPPQADHPLVLQARLRSTQEPADAFFFAEMQEGRGHILLQEPVYGVAAGQAGVLYDGSRVLGGGWIDGAVLQGLPRQA